MNVKRLARDISILIVLCGLFYASTFFIVTDEVSASTEQSETDFSEARVQADELTVERDWSAAADEFKKLAEADPYNGFANWRLAASYVNIRYTANRQIADGNVDGKTLTDAEIAELQKRIDDHEELAVNALNKAREFLRYRSKACYHLAVILSDRGDLEEALTCLKEYAELGGWTYGGLASTAQFGMGDKKMATNPSAFITSKTRLHQFPEFWDIVEVERRTRRKMAVPRPLNVNTGIGR